MANNKAGLKYYTVDTDRYEDRRIKRLKKDMGCRGIAVYDRILCEVYRVRGYYLEWDRDTAFDIAEYFGLKEDTVNEIVRSCCTCGLFDAEKLTEQKIITSASIQQRYREMCFRAKRRIAEIAEQYSCASPALGMPTNQEDYNNDSLDVDDDLETLTLDDEIEFMQSDEEWMMQIQELHNLTKTELVNKLSQFKAECYSNGKMGHDSEQDAKKHFNSWLRKISKNKDKNNNDTAETKRRGKRRGVLLTSDESKTYGDAF